MAFRDVLLQLRSYPDSTPIGVVERAVQLSKLFGAHISALTFEIRMNVPCNALAKSILDIPGMIARERGNSIRNARDLIAQFDETATNLGVVHGHIVERCSNADIPDIVSDHARVHDLTMVPMEEPPAFQQSVADCVIFKSGRPVLLLPAESNRPGPICIDHVGVAWDFGRPAARALADALPLLLAAKSVRLVTVTNEKTFETKRSSSDVLRHLAGHGVEAISDNEDAGGLSIGGALKRYAATHNLDVLVMGAYGHSRARDFLKGGATKSMVNAPPLPVFLSH